MRRCRARNDRRTGLPTSALVLHADSGDNRIKRRLLRMSEHDEVPQGWLTVESAARYLDTTPGALRALVKRHSIPVHRTPHGRLRFNREELDAWVTGGERS